jgi:hypothetical protein
MQLGTVIGISTIGRIIKYDVKMQNNEVDSFSQRDLWKHDKAVKFEKSNFSAILQSEFQKFLGIMLAMTLDTYSHGDMKDYWRSNSSEESQNKL